MGLDIKKLRGMQKDLNKKSGGGDGLYLYSNKLGEEQDIRILPPPDESNGMYFVEQEGWWINGKFFLSNSTEVLGGGPDVVQEEVDKAKASGDKTLTALIDKKKNNIPVIKKEFRYLVPVLTLDAKYDDDDQLVSCEVEDKRILVAKPTLIKAINMIVTGRQFQNQTEHGVADRIKGYNIIVGRQGKGIDTEYIAIGWNEQMEIDEKHYKDAPNPWEQTRKAGKSDEYLRSVIRNYLYGEEVLAEGESNSEDADESVKEEPKKKSQRPSRSTAKKAEEKPKSKKPSGRSLLDDAEEDLNDLD